VKRPTIEQLTDYFFLQLQNLDASKEEAERFFNYYNSVGWKVGGNKKMVRWKSSVQNWIKNLNKWNDERKGKFTIKRYF